VLNRIGELANETETEACNSASNLSERPIEIGQSNTVFYCDGIVHWPLANGGITKISPCDVDVVAQRVWRAVKIANHSYACTTADRRRLYLHRLLCGDAAYWDELSAKWRTYSIDHIDNDGLNNTRRNLRLCDHRQNQQNGVGHPKRRRSRFKGVAYYPNRKDRQWRSTITVAGEQMHLGYFDTEEDAARRYNEYARKYFGEFARLNVIDQPAGSAVETLDSGSRSP
jgi:hypothetical protein